jgi:hypothetical protein
MEFIIANKNEILRRYMNEPDFNLRMMVTKIELSKSCGDIGQRNDWVTPKIVAAVQTKLPCAIAPARRVQVQPILMKNQCHYNSWKMAEYYEDRFTPLLGYNVTACPCGYLWGLELHSVLRDNATDEWIDLTRDFGGETAKWFIPIKENATEDDVEIIKMMGRHDVIYSTKQDHDCCMPCGREISWEPDKRYPCGDDVWDSANRMLGMVRDGLITVINFDE